MNRGDKFGKLTVIGRVPTPERLRHYGHSYLCQCECGRRVVLIAAYLRYREKMGCYTCGCAIRQSQLRFRRRGYMMALRFWGRWLSPEWAEQMDENKADAMMSEIYERMEDFELCPGDPTGERELLEQFARRAN